MMSLLLFWALNVVVHLLSMQGQKALRFHQKYLNLCSKDERRSYRFGTTWGWVMTEFWQFWVNYPFMVIFLSGVALKSKSCTSKYSVVSSLTPMTRTPLNSCHWHWHQNLHILRAFVEILQIYNMTGKNGKRQSDGPHLWCSFWLVLDLERSPSTYIVWK